jgi:hypothetical protein
VRIALVALALALAPRVARADDPPAEPPSEPAPAPEPEPTPKPPLLAAPAHDDEAAARIDELEDRMRALEAELRRAQVTREDVKSLLPLRDFITVFVDAGAFVVGGNGEGIRSDLDHVYFPKYAGIVPGQWVLMGDPLATAINSLGEPADATDSRELTNDTLRSGGHPSVILNSLGLAIGKDVGHDFAVAGLVELLPRPGHDILDVELAHVDYRPSHAVQLLIQAGKIDSVLGVEYRTQDATKRIGITPSLICRYTCNRQLGVSARLERGRIVAAGALTNGNDFDQRFEPLTSLHASAVPTASGHLQWIAPVGTGLELGVSGAVGAQTNQSDSHLVQWHYGFDARLFDLHRFDFVAEFVQGHQPGKSTEMALAPCDLAPCLTYKGAYVFVDRRTNTWLTPYVRVDWRDAVHQNGVQFVYESHVVRATFGARFAVTSRIVGKIEYTFVRELHGIPQFPDDVLTTSIVVATD